MIEGRTVTSPSFVIEKNEAVQENISLLLDGFASQHPHENL